MFLTILITAIVTIIYFVCAISCIEKMVMIEDKEWNIIRFIVSLLPIVHAIYGWYVLKVWLKKPFKKSWWKEQFTI